MPASGIFRFQKRLPMTTLAHPINRSNRVPVFLALLISIGFHLGLWRLNPSILLTGGPGFESAARVAPPPRLRLDRLSETRPRALPADVEARLPKAGSEEPESLSLESDPAALIPVLPDSGLEWTLDPDALQIRPTRPVPLPGELVPREAAWPSRPEILAIREPRVRASPEARPRQVVERVESEEPVPDFFPTLEELHVTDDIADAGLQFDLMSLGTETESSSLHSGGADEPAFMASVPEAEPQDWQPELRPPGLPSRLEDQSSFIYSSEMADRILRITAQAYVDPARPAHRYVKLQLRPSEIGGLSLLPRDVLFLLDASARVSPGSFQHLSRAVSGVLETLTPTDRFNIYLLQSGITRLFEETQTATPLNLARARGRLAQTRPQGRGELFAGLNQLLDFSGPPDRLRIAVVVTDGVPSLSLGDSTAYIEQFTRSNAGDMSVFTVGVGRQVNRYLLDFLSFQNRGDSLVTEQALQVGDALGLTLQGLRRPLLRHLSYRFVDGDRLEVYPHSLTHLYLDRPLILVLRVPLDQETLTVQIAGHSHEGPQDMLYTLDVARIPPGPWSLRQDWAWQALLHHVSTYLQTGDPAVRERLGALSRTYGIAVPYGLAP